MKWIKCSDQPYPKQGKFLVWDQLEGIAVAYYNYENNLIKGGWYGGCESGCGGDCYLNAVKYWMWLPEEPNEEIK